MQLMIPGQAGHVRLKEDQEYWQSADMHTKTQGTLKKKSYTEQIKNI